MNIEDTRERILRFLDRKPADKAFLFTRLKLLGERWNHAAYVVNSLRDEGLVAFNVHTRCWQRTRRRAR